MKPSAPLSSFQPALPRRKILAAGVLVGVLDISYVLVLWVLLLKKTTVMRIWQSIATGLLGRDAYQGGLPTAVLGGLLHFTIAMTWAGIYGQAYQHWPALRRQVRSAGGAIAVGFLLGPLIWLTMDFVVLPLSRATPVPVHAWPFWANLLQHGVMVGTPIALVVRADDPATSRSSHI